MNTRRIVFFICMIWGGIINAQPPCNSTLPEDGRNCSDFGFPICNINDINGYCDRLPRRNPLNADGWCGDNSVVTNGSVFRFFVNSSNVSVRVYWSDCGFNEPEGVQAAVYEGCTNDFRFPISCVNTCFNLENPAEFNFVGVAGQDYTLLVDGCFANQCEYVVEIITDNPDPVIRVEEWEESDEIAGPGINNSELCNGLRSSCAEFSINSRLAATEYLWILDGVSVGQGNQPSINLENNNNRLVDAQLCVQAINRCDSNELVCATLRGALKTVQSVDSCLCPFNLNDFNFRGDQFASEVVGRVYEDIDACGCVDTTLFNLELIVQDTLKVGYAVCDEDLQSGIRLPGQLDTTVVTQDSDTRVLYTLPSENYSCNSGIVKSCSTFTEVNFLLAEISGFLPDRILPCDDEQIFYSLDNLRYQPDVNALDLNISWINASGDIIGADKELSIVEPGEYILEIEYTHNEADVIFSSCFFRDTFSVFQDDKLPADAINYVVEEESCFGLNNGRLTVMADRDSILVSIDGGPFTDSLSFDSLRVGPHYIEIVAANGCSIIDTINVLPGDSAQYEIAVSDSIFFKGQTIALEIIDTDREALVSTEWSVDGTGRCSPCPSLTFVPDRSQTIKVIIEDIDGCIDSAFVDVQLLNEDAVYIPNVFSPRSENEVNQRFTIFTDETVESIIRVDIFNRWGAQVYSRQNALPLEPLWDGTFKGEVSLDGVYVYRTTVRFINGEERVYTGDITLLN